MTDAHSEVADLVERKLIVYFDDAEERARVFATAIGYDVAPLNLAPNGWHLCLNESDLTLRHPDKQSMRLSLDDIRRRSLSGRRSPLSRACGVRDGMTVLDAFAGWGTDGLTLATLGCRVTCCELQPLVFAMLYDRIKRSEICSLNGIRVDVGELLADRMHCWDVVYLDPMFPLHPKTALPSYPMQVLADIADQSDTREIAEWSFECANQRVVIKNRIKDPPLIRSPDWQIRARSVRFDVYRANRN